MLTSIKKPERDTRVLFSCTGIGIMNRGIESFFSEAFEGLKDLDKIRTRLIIGKGEITADESKAIRLSRFSAAAHLIGKVTGRTAYAIEQISSLPSIIKEIRRFKPHVIFSSEANLFFLLHRFRSLVGVPYKLLFSNGGPLDGPFNWTDYVHQVSPAYLQKPLSTYEMINKHILVPYGIHVPSGNFYISDSEKISIRNQLQLPVNRKILISVGWISSAHKRMDYTVTEVAAVPKHIRPFLILLGNMDEASKEIIQLAAKSLAPDDYVIRSVPYSQVNTYYMASDYFVLSSLHEGFGRVYLEALVYNLPVIAHYDTVMQYVVGEAGILADLSKKGSLTQILSCLIGEYKNTVIGRDYVRNKFDWEVLRDQYRSMFLKANETSIPDARKIVSVLT